MSATDLPAGEAVRKTRMEQAEARTEHAETRAEQAKTRAEQAETRTERAETRTEQAETRTDLAKTRTEQAEARTERAETRAEQAETTLERVVHPEAESGLPLAARPLKRLALPEVAGGRGPLERLTRRQREILQLIAEGQNTKSIAELLSISPKTVEYHRLKLMHCLNVHDIAGLVRFALRVGMLPQES